MWHLFFLFAFLFWVCALRAVQSFFTMSCKLFLSCCVEKRTFLRRGKPTTLRFDALEVEELKKKKKKKKKKSPSLRAVSLSAASYIKSIK